MHPHVCREKWQAAMLASRLDPAKGTELCEDAQKVHDKYKPAAQSPILTAVAVVDGLELTTGFGSPTDGSAFVVGADQHAAAHGLMRSAGADSR